MRPGRRCLRSRRCRRERVSDELRKLLAAKRPSLGLAIADRTKILALIAPELAAGLTSPEVIAHWLARVDAAPEDVRLGAMFAELAPPEPARRLDRKLVDHATQVLKALKFSNDEAALASTLVALGQATRVATWTPADVRKLLGDVTRARVSAAQAFLVADGARGLAAEVAAVAGDPIAVGELALAGKDLIAALEMKPGPLVGRILGALLERVLVDPSLNTREALIAVARGLELELAR